MMRNLSRQFLSPPLELWTRFARIAASRMSAHPAASHAAGTVSSTSAVSVQQPRASARAPPPRPCAPPGAGATLTQVGDRADLLRDLTLGVPPDTAEKVGDDVHRVLAVRKGREARVRSAGAHRVGREVQLEPLASGVVRALVSCTEGRWERAGPYLTSPGRTAVFFASRPHETISATSFGVGCE